MLKKILKFSLIAFFMVSITACGGKGGNSTDRGGGVEEEESFPNTFISQGATGMEFVAIQNGTFVMGTTDTGKNEVTAVNISAPKHNVTISKPYYMGIYEVTQGQWLSLNSTNPSKNTFQPEGEDLSNHPVNNLTKPDVIGFIQAMNEDEPNITINGEQYIYDLPTEAEWEHAVRAGTTGDRFFIGDDEAYDLIENSATEQEFFDMLYEYAWTRGNPNTLDRHHEVGSLKPNPWGLYDVYGNVYEMVLDKCVMSVYYVNVIKEGDYLTEDITDPLCWSENSSVYYATRSSGYINNDGYAWTGMRTSSYAAPSVMITAEWIGFRVALVAKSVRDNMTKFANRTIIP